jgi:hypothetical protein
LVSLAVCASASAATVPLGTSGWQATWDASLDPFVNITFIQQVGDTVVIEKTAEFTQGPDEFGLFPTIPITFQQVAPSTVNEIVIAQETLTNSTGVDWTDFHWDLLDGGDVWFDTVGFQFDTTPLTNQAFSPDNTSFFVDGFGLGPGGTDAVVADGTTWTPGAGPNDNLVMDVVSTGSTVFTLKETPTPEPGTLALLALGAIGVLRRRA